MVKNLNTLNYKFSFSELALSENEILYPMGYMENDSPEMVLDIIQSEFEFLQTVTDIAGGFRMVTPQFLKDDYRIVIENQTFRTDKIVWQLLKKSEQLAIFICTAGSIISDRSKNLMAKGDLLEGYVVDTIGSVAVEKAMDIIHEKIKNISGKSTNRYSPGYCNWNVAEQQKLFSLMPSNYSGVSLSESSLMSPVKSVSGFIGIGNQVKFNDYTCNYCTQQNCIYSKTRSLEQT